MTDSNDNPYKVAGIAIVPEGGLQIATETAEVTRANTALNGTWAVKSFFRFSKGSAVRSDRSGDTIDFEFEGRVLKINAYKSPTQGSIGITIDDQEEVVVSLLGDTYDGETETVYLNNQLSAGSHTASIRFIGGTCTAADGTAINSSAIIDTVETENGKITKGDIKSTVYQAEEDEGWTMLNFYSFNGGAAAKSTDASSAPLYFVDTAKTVKIFSYKSPTQGTLTVKITAGGQEYIEDVVLTSNAAADSDFGEVFSKTFDAEQEIEVEITNAGGSVYVDYVEFIK